VTTRGFGIEEVKRVASLIVRVLSRPEDERTQQRVHEEVREICQQFPIPGLE
jgi:glycine hydroxymethyltransferase